MAHGKQNAFEPKGPCESRPFCRFPPLEKSYTSIIVLEVSPFQPQEAAPFGWNKTEDFSQQLASSSLSFNNRMNGLRAAEGIKKHYARLERSFPPATLFPCIRIIQRRGTLLWRVPLHCSPNTDDSFTKILKNDPTETLRKRPKKFQTEKRKKESARSKLETSPELVLIN